MVFTVQSTDAHFPAARILTPLSPLYKVFVILYLFPACLLLTINNKENTGEARKVCGIVRTSANKTVVLREGFNLTPEEFENVHLRKLKDALFSAEKNCTIKVCGHTWTDKPFHFDLIGALTRNYADCEIIKYANTSKASSNIYNDSFNVSSISCGCQRDVPDCKVTCLNRIKMNIEWKENQCAILYQERNCGQCWFPPVPLYEGENYTTNNSHFINAVILREHCKGEQSIPRKSDLRRSTTAYFKAFESPVVRITDKTTHLSEFSTFKCECPDKFITTVPTKPTAIATSNDNLMTSPSALSLPPETTMSTSPLRLTTLVSCASIKPATSPVLELFENSPIDREAFERVRVGKLKNATFSVGKNWNGPMITCILEVCGHNRYDGACNRYTSGDRQAPPEIYTDDYQASSLSCSCTTEDLTDCSGNKCFVKNATISWKDQECAVMYREKKCNSCYFKPIILRDNERFYSLNSYAIKSLIVRPGCEVEVASKVSETWDGPWTDLTKQFDNIIAITGPSYHRDSENFTCYCNPKSATSPITSTLKPSTIISTTTEAASFSCAYIKPRPTGTPPIRFFENTIVDRDVFESIRVGKLVNVLFTPGTSWSDPDKCVLEICGFSSTGSFQYRQGTCEWYRVPIRAPPEIYNKNFEVSSVGCACRTKVDSNCKTETCVAKNTVHAWKGKVCAVMFQEEECRSCYFKPINLLYGEGFFCLNSYQFKSMLIRPGCYVEKETNGAIWIDEPHIYEYKNVTSKIGATFHKDSENFSCVCSPEVIQDMLLETTTVEPATESEEPVSTTENTVTPTPQPNTTTVPPSISTTVFPLLQSTVTIPASNALSTAKYAVFGVGFTILIAIAVILIKRYKTTQQPTNNEDAVISSTIERNDNGNTGALCSIEENPLDDQPIKALPVSPRLENTEINSTSQNGFEETSDLSSLVAAVESVDNPKEQNPNENPLKVEIMDEVKRLVESFLSSLGQDELQNLRAEEESQTQTPPTPPISEVQVAATQSAEEFDSKFDELMERFHQVCKPEHVFTRSMFTVPNQSWEKPVGKGLVGIVYKGQLRLEPDGLVEKVAIKKIKWLACQESVMEAESFLREIRTYEWIGAENDYIVRFFGACCDPDGLYILTKFCEGGSLREYLQKKMRPKVFPNDGTEQNGYGYILTPVAKLDLVDLHQLLDWCAQISCGMEHLSKKGIIHVDLAVRNILLSEDNTVKICDFGLSKKCLNTDDCAQSLLTGEFPFNSFTPEANPENIYEPRQVSLFVDIWSFGCTVWEMFTLGDSLYQCVQKKGLYKILAVRDLLLTGYRHPPPELAPDYVYETMLECWSEIPKNRPSFTHLCNFFETKRLKVLEKLKNELPI